MNSYSLLRQQQANVQAEQELLEPPQALGNTLKFAEDYRVCGGGVSDQMILVMAGTGPWVTGS